jgi:hypothetical protein
VRGEPDMGQNVSQESAGCSKNKFKTEPTLGRGFIERRGVQVHDLAAFAAEV